MISLKPCSRLISLLVSPPRQRHSLITFNSSSRLVCRAMSSRGAFLVFEGADRAGKSTQCQMLVDYLNEQGVKTELWRFPDRTTSMGKMINSYLTSETDIDDAAVHLIFSANRWEKRTQLLQKLRDGVTLVVDRYAYSGVAFTAAKGITGLDRQWCMAPDAGLPAPDATFYLHLSAEAAQKRGGYGEERYEKEAFQKAVMQQFEALRQPDWHWVDADRTIDEIQGELRSAAVEAVAACKQGADIKALWDGTVLASDDGKEN